MPRMRDAKILGALGYALILLGIVTAGNVAWLVLVGLVLASIAVKYISEIVNDSSVFTNWTVATAIEVIGLAGVTLVAGIALIAPIQCFPSGGFASGTLVTLVAFFVVIWMAFMVSAVFERRAYNRVADLTKVDLFRTAGTIAIIGAVTMIVLVGIILILINLIVLAVAFFSLPDEYSPPLPPPPEGVFRT